MRTDGHRPSKNVTVSFTLFSSRRRTEVRGTKEKREWVNSFNALQGDAKAGEWRCRGTRIVVPASVAVRNAIDLRLATIAMDTYARSAPSSRKTCLGFA